MRTGRLRSLTLLPSALTMELWDLNDKKAMLFSIAFFAGVSIIHGNRHGYSYSRG
jgi:hypothetical protein